MRSVNPANGQLIGDYPEHTREQWLNILQKAQEAFARWRQTSFSHRSALMFKTATVLREGKKTFAELMTREMGKPITDSAAEVDKCALTCEFFAQNAERFLATEGVKSEASDSHVRYEPLGPVLAVMPWNFPFWQVFRFAAPGLMAGNVGVLKHASNVPGTALAIEGIFQEAGFPEGIFSTLLVPSGVVEKLVEQPAICAVTLTGSEKAGTSIAAAAGRQLKKVVLELGGSDPFIVLADVDVTWAAGMAAKARCINSGQSCIAAKRFIVDRRIAPQFEKAMVDAMQALKLGDPMDPGTQVGPLAREDLLDSLHDQVQRAVRAGARVLCGGKRIDRPGFYYEPTVLGNVQKGNPAFDEETFGPVAAITEAQSPDHAVQLANESTFGLGASLWTRDLDLARKLTQRIEAGMVFVNAIVKSDPRLPFGGVKRSGFGRELSEVGIREFVNQKTVWIDAAR